MIEWTLIVTLHAYQGGTSERLYGAKTEDACIQYAQERWKYFHASKFPGDEFFTQCHANKKGTHWRVFITCEPDGACTYKHYTGPY